MNSSVFQAKFACMYIWKESCDEMSSSVVACVMWVVAGKV